MKILSARRQGFFVKNRENFARLKRIDGAIMPQHDTHRLFSLWLFWLGATFAWPSLATECKTALDDSEALLADTPISVERPCPAHSPKDSDVPPIGTAPIAAQRPGPTTVNGLLKNAFERVAGNWGYSVDWRIDERKGAFSLRFDVGIPGVSLAKDLEALAAASRNESFSLRIDIYKTNRVVVASLKGDQ